LIAFFSLLYLFSLFGLQFSSALTSRQSEPASVEKDHFLIQPKANPTPTPMIFSLIVGGDLMFDRHVRTKAEVVGNYDFIFDQKLSDFLNSADYALANLEGPITMNQSVSQNSLPGGPGNYTFTFSPEIIQVLKNNNLTLINLGNNHILNFGVQGLRSTRQYLNDVDLIFFGDVGESQEQQRYYFLEHFEQKIALISYNQFVEGGKSKTLADISEAKNEGASLILLFSHWGNEYVPGANQVIVDLAHEFIDAGVDLIVGGHPHVIQNKEIYQGKTIYYSLGNFVFDQYFSKETQEGLLLKIDFTFNPDFSTWTYQIEEERVQMGRDGITRLQTEETE